MKEEKGGDGGPEGSNADTPATNATSFETGSEDTDRDDGVIAKAER